MDPLNQIKRKNRFEWLALVIIAAIVLNFNLTQIIGRFKHPELTSTQAFLKGWQFFFYDFKK
jgi:hypothetical protein